MSARRYWYAAEIKRLRALYPDTLTADVAKTLGRPITAVHHKAQKLGLKKSKAFNEGPNSGRMRQGLAEAGKAFRFKKGNRSWNTGTHWTAGGRSAETRFKKGRPAHEAHNYLPIGTQRMSKDGYLERKVTDDPRLWPARRWTPVHRLVWIEHNGPIPAGHVIAFKPGRFTNDIEKITVEALELVSRAEMARRNRMWVIYPKPLAQLIHLNGQLKRRIRNKERHAQEHQ